MFPLCVAINRSPPVIKRERECKKIKFKVNENENVGTL